MIESEITYLLDNYHRMTIGEFSEKCLCILRNIEKELPDDINFILESLNNLRKILLKTSEYKKYISKIDNLISYFDNVSPKEIIEDIGAMITFARKLRYMMKLYNEIIDTVLGFKITGLEDFINWINT